SGTAGDLIVIHGPFGGGINPSESVKLGGQNLPLLAQSSDMLVALNTTDTPGRTELETDINGKVTKNPFDVFKVTVTAGSLHLLKGEGTTVNILVSGLAALNEPAKM